MKKGDKIGPFKVKKIESTIDIGNTIICDLCNEDYTNSDMCGGFIMGSYGVCPKCEPRMRARLKKYNEEDHIKAECPPGMTHREFIIRARGGNNIMQVASLE